MIVTFLWWGGAVADEGNFKGDYLLDHDLKKIEKEKIEMSDHANPYEQVEKDFETWYAKQSARNRNIAHDSIVDYYDLYELDDREDVDHNSEIYVIEGYNIEDGDLALE